MSTNPEPKRTRHDPDFKQQAVQLLNTSGRLLAQVARELGLPAWQLRDCFPVACRVSSGAASLIWSVVHPKEKRL